MHVSLGRIVLKPRANRLRFYWHTVRAYLQALRAPGNVSAAVRGDGAGTYWSMSVWHSKGAMLVYRNSGSHLQAMRVSTALAERIEFRQWEVDVAPPLDEAINEFKRQAERAAPVHESCISG